MSGFSSPNPSNNYRVLPVSIDLNREETQVVEDIKQLVLSMLSLPAEEHDNLRVSPLTGGITNRLYLVENVTKPKLNVIVRFFGEGTHEFIDRTAENMVFSALSDHKFGPRFEGLFENGRVEGYINARCLSPEEMSHPSIYSTVAALVHKLHTIHLPDFFSYQKGWKANGEENEEWKRIANQTEALQAEPWVWKKIHLFFHMAGDIIHHAEESGDAQKIQKYHDLNIQRMVEESKWLKHAIDKILAQVGYHMHYHDHVHGLKAPDGKHDRVSMRDKGMAFALEEVLCHNDLLSGNLLVNQAADQPLDVRLIDYEYAAYNYRCYDMANHFCEFAGFDFNVDTYPSSAVRRDFIKAYLAQSRVKNDFDDEFIDGMENMIELMTLLSCLFWGTWAVVQSGKDLGIDFDYLSYAKRRFDGYFFFKESFDLV